MGTPQPNPYGTTPSEPHTQGAHKDFSGCFASQSTHTQADPKLLVPEGHMALGLPGQGGPIPRAAPPLPQRDLGEVVSPPGLSLPSLSHHLTGPTSLGVCLAPAHGTTTAFWCPRSTTVCKPSAFPPIPLPSSLPG